MKLPVNELPWTRSKEENGLLADEEFCQKNGVIADKESFIAESVGISTKSLEIGFSSFIAKGCVLTGEIKIGSKCSANVYTHICGQVTIGDGVRIGTKTSIFGFNHGYDDVDAPIYTQKHISKGITIKDDVWIGANVVIVDGVTVNAHSIIAAGAVVTKDVPEYSVVGGNPAKVIRNRKTNKRPEKDDLKSRLNKYSSQLSRDWKNILERTIIEKDGQQLYHDPKFDGPTKRAYCDAVEIAAALGGNITNEKREDVIKNIQSMQDPVSGLCIPSLSENKSDHELLTNEYNYNTMSAGYALMALGEKLLHPISVVDRVSMVNVLDHLKNMNWKTGAWGCGSWVDIYSTFHYFNKRYFNIEESLEIVFGYLTKKSSKFMGMWGDLSEESGWLQPVNGFYRLTRGSYAQFGYDLPNVESAIDTVFTHTRCSGFSDWKNITACNILDIVHPFWLCSQQSNYRKDEIIALMEQLLPQMIQQYQKDKGFAFQPGEVVGLMGTEMWMSIIYIAADLLGIEKELNYKPEGIHYLFNKK